MPEQFKKHLEKFMELTEAEYAGIQPYLTVRKVRKKEDLLRAGEVCRYHYFVLSGCLRMFFITEKGVEQTTEFAIENWWITDVSAYEHRAVSNCNIQAVEHSEIILIEAAAQEALLERFPQMERYFRLVYQRAYAAAQNRIRYLYDFSREELYYHFEAHYPEFIQRVPQYLIASFLGFTPEYLSEIRAKRRS